ncbi:MAG: hypothetical protein AAF353_18560 [Pseudomonadota bacterium]
MHKNKSVPVIVLAHYCRKICSDLGFRMQFDTLCSLEAFQEAASRRITQGIQIIRGCCGLGPEHL